MAHFTEQTDLVLVLNIIQPSAICRQKMSEKKTEFDILSTHPLNVDAVNMANKMDKFLIRYRKELSIMQYLRSMMNMVRRRLS